jgi:5-methyltetrahydrofolate--homocysteine methyltransferase
LTVNIKGEEGDAMVVNKSNSETITELIRSVVEYDVKAVPSAVEKALKAGVSPLRILEEGLSVGINKVGDEFGCGNAFLPELLMASKAMEIGINILKDHWRNMESERKTFGKILLGTVKGDVHNIGKQILASLMLTAGFKVFDIGVDIPEKTFVEKVKEIKPDILGLSALLTTSMPQQGYVIQALEKEGIRRAVKIMVGGAPTSEEWARKIGADGWAPNAVMAIKEAKKLLNVE